MKKIIKALKFPTAILLIISFIACDKEFSTIESNVLGNNNSNFNTNKIDISVLAYNKKLEAVQINNLASHLLGFYDDPAYGTTTASLVTQLLPSTTSPDFGDDTVIDSVVLTIPYYTSLTGEFDDNGNASYSIDSLYGDDSIKLSIYQNNYFIRDLNPDLNLNEAQNYFSYAGNGDLANNYVLIDNSSINFVNFKGELIYEEAQFTPSSENIYLYTYSDEDSDEDGDLDVESIDVVTPSLRVKFDNTDFWKELIIDKEGDVVLDNANNFKDYFRGLYFKAESINSDGNMVLLNTASTNANITIYYTANNNETDDDGNITSTTEFQSTYILNFSGNILNTFINDYQINLDDGDDVLGDEKLFLKGTEGSMAIVDLFDDEDLDNNDVPDALESLRNDFIDGSGNPTRLINEAILVVYEDDDTRASFEDDSHDYDRLYVYDVNNNTTLIDYSFDATTNTADPLNSTFIHLGLRDTIGDGFGFKIRITEHLNNLIYNDSTNTKIGLVLSNNVTYTTNAEILNSEHTVPAASIITPRGNIMHGSNDNVPADRKMKLEIYYTEPNQ